MGNSGSKSTSKYEIPNYNKIRSTESPFDYSSLLTHHPFVTLDVPVFGLAHNSLLTYFQHIWANYGDLSQFDLGPLAEPSSVAFKGFRHPAQTIPTEARLFASQCYSLIPTNLVVSTTHPEPASLSPTSDATNASTSPPPAPGTQFTLVPSSHALHHFRHTFYPDHLKQLKNQGGMPGAALFSTLASRYIFEQYLYNDRIIYFDGLTALYTNPTPAPIPSPVSLAVHTARLRQQTQQQQQQQQPQPQADNDDNGNIATSRPPSSTPLPTPTTSVTQGQRAPFSNNPPLPTPDPASLRIVSFGGQDYYLIQHPRFVNNVSDFDLFSYYPQFIFSNPHHHTPILNFTLCPRAVSLTRSHFTLHNYPAIMVPTIGRGPQQPEPSFSEAFDRAEQDLIQHRIDHLQQQQGAPLAPEMDKKRLKAHQKMLNNEGKFNVTPPTSAVYSPASPFYYTHAAPNYQRLGYLGYQPGQLAYIQQAMQRLMPLSILYLNANSTESLHALYSFILFHLQQQLHHSISFNTKAPVIVILQEQALDNNNQSLSEHQICTTIMEYLNIDAIVINEGVSRGPSMQEEEIDPNDPVGQTSAPPPHGPPRSAPLSYILPPNAPSKQIPPTTYFNIKSYPIPHAFRASSPPTLNQNFVFKRIAPSPSAKETHTFETRTNMYFDTPWIGTNPLHHLRTVHMAAAEADAVAKSQSANDGANENQDDNAAKRTAAAKGATLRRQQRLADYSAKYSLLNSLFRPGVIEIYPDEAVNGPQTEKYQALAAASANPQSNPTPVRDPPSSEVVPVDAHTKQQFVHIVAQLDDYVTAFVMQNYAPVHLSTRGSNTEPTSHTNTGIDDSDARDNVNSAPTPHLAPNPYLQERLQHILFSLTMPSALSALSSHPGSTTTPVNSPQFVPPSQPSQLQLQLHLHNLQTRTALDNLQRFYKAFYPNILEQYQWTWLLNSSLLSTTPAPSVAPNTHPSTTTLRHIALILPSFMLARSPGVLVGQDEKKVRPDSKNPWIQPPWTMTEYFVKGWVSSQAPQTQTLQHDPQLASPTQPNNTLPSIHQEGQEQVPASQLPTTNSISSAAAYTHEDSQFAQLLPSDTFLDPAPYPGSPPSREPPRTTIKVFNGHPRDCAAAFTPPPTATSTASATTETTPTAPNPDSTRPPKHAIPLHHITIPEALPFSTLPRLAELTASDPHPSTPASNSTSSLTPTTSSASNPAPNDPSVKIAFASGLPVEYSFRYLGDDVGHLGEQYTASINHFTLTTTTTTTATATTTIKNAPQLETASAHSTVSISIVSPDANHLTDGRRVDTAAVPAFVSTAPMVGITNFTSKPHAPARPPVVFPFLAQTLPMDQIIAVDQYLNTTAPIAAHSTTTTSAAPTTPVPPLPEFAYHVQLTNRSKLSDDQSFNHKAQAYKDIQAAPHLFPGIIFASTFMPSVLLPRLSKSDQSNFATHGTSTGELLAGISSIARLDATININIPYFFVFAVPETFQLPKMVRPIPLLNKITMTSGHPVPSDDENEPPSSASSASLAAVNQFLNDLPDENAGDVLGQSLQLIEALKSGTFGVDSVFAMIEQLGHRPGALSGYSHVDQFVTSYMKATGAPTSQPLSMLKGLSQAAPEPNLQPDTTTASHRVGIGLQWDGQIAPCVDQSAPSLTENDGRSATTTTELFDAYHTHKRPIYTFVVRGQAGYMELLPLINQIALAHYFGAAAPQASRSPIPQ